MKRKFTKLIAAAVMLLTMMASTGTMWGQTRDEGDELAICVGNSSNAYAVRTTLTDEHYVGWVLATSNVSQGVTYLGTNSSSNHAKVKPTVDDIPVVKAVNGQYTYTSTTGYYFYYTTTPIANVGSLEFSYTASTGNNNATGYVVVGDAVSASGGDAYTQIELDTESTSAQGVTLGASGTFTFTFAETQTEARYYGFIIKTNTYKRLTGGTIKLLEGGTDGPTQLTAPANFSASAGNAQATFSWTEVDHASNYTILAKNGDTWDNPTTLFDNVSLTNGQYVGTGLSNGTTYVCKVRANGDGTNYSNSALSEATATFTPTAAQQYTVTIADGITGGTVGANPTTATAGTTIHVTANPNGGYYLSALSYTYGQTTTDIDQTTLQFEMPASNVTINATFTAYTVTLNAGNGTVNNETTYNWNVSLNNGNLPDAVPPCNTWSFYGWSTAAANTQTTTAPTCVNGTGYTPEGNITLYAVYSKTESSGPAFNGTTSTGSFLIYATVSATNHYATGTGSKINSTTNASEATSYTFEQPSGYNSGEFAIKTGNDYITYSSSTNLGTSSNPYKWTISEGTNGTWRLTSETSGRGFIFRAGSSNVFGGYSTGNVTANGTEYYDLEIGGGSTTYYWSTPDCVETVATPTFDVNEGTYYEPQIIIIECETTGASIYYTLNGEEPTSTESATNFLYDENEGVEISSTTTLKAKAFKTGMNPSATRTATYTIIHDVAEPTLAESQLFTTDTYSVAITVPANTTVYYTTDGTAPTNASTPYTTAFNINATTTVKAIAYDGDGCASDVVTATYTRAYTLAAAKALYEGSNVTNVTISLTGVQFIAKSGSSTYMQQGTTGLMIYGSHSQDLTNGDVFTAGTVTGTITKYGENLELSISSGAFANVAKTAGTLTASATDVEITDITGEFSTYESRYVSLTSLEMDLDNLELSDGTNTLAIYDHFNVLDGAIQPDDDVNVTGVVTSYYKNSNTTYQIIPLAKSGITTGIAATLPTLDPVGGADAAHAVSIETVKVTPATSTTVTYSFGSSAYGEIDAETEITVPSTEATELEVVASRDFYTDNSASYYYMSAAASYTVNFYENGELTYYEENVVSGTSLAISSTTAPNGYEFMGWTTSAISGVQAGAPATLYNGSVTVEDDMNLYAVYALEGDASVSYNRVDGYSSITEGTYLIAVNKVDSDNFNFANGQAASGHAGVEATGVATATSYTASDIPEGALEYTLAGNNTDGFSIHCSNGYLNGGSTKASLSYGNSATEKWIFSNKDGGLVLTGANNSSKASCNSTTAASAIRNYASSGSYYDPLYFFKKTETPAYSNYCTTITYTTYNDDETRTTPILANEIVTVLNGTVLTLNTTNGGTAANLIIEDGGILITHTDGIQATVEKNITAVGATNWAATSGAQGWYFIASPVDGAAFTTATVDDYDLYMLDWANNYWRNLKNNENESLFANGFQRGTGYLYASKDGKTISVAGEIQALSSDDDATVTLATTGWNLIGNPLTCKVTVDHSFGLLNNGSAIDYTGTTVNPFQGIVVWGNANDVVTFTKAATQNAAAPSNNSSLQMTLSQNIVTRGNTTSTTVDNAVVSFKEGNVLPKFSMLEGNAKLYIPQGNEEYAIVSTNGQGEMPVNFLANEDGQYTITVNTENVEMNYLHLIDNKTGNDVDLLATPSYTFNATTMDYASRFRLVFSANNSEANAENSDFAFISNGQIILTGNNSNATLQVIDMMGRIVNTQQVNGTALMAPVANGVYVLQLINGNEVKTQKIVVK